MTDKNEIIMPKDVKLVFYHIEKCGGTSIRNSLYEYFSKIYKKNLIFEPVMFGNSSINFNPECIKFIMDSNKVEYNEIKVILSHTRYNYFPNLNSPIKITFIRDPIDRLISHYYYFIFKNTKVHMIDMPENEFNLYCKWSGHYMCECLGILNKDDTFNNQKCDERLKEFSFIGKLEHFDEGIIHMNKLFNEYFKVNQSINIIKDNENKNKNIKEFEKLKKKILPFCTCDYILYNKFDKFICNYPSKSV